jgi:predicted alpha/beta-fold hydrolase
MTEPTTTQSLCTRRRHLANVSHSFETESFHPSWFATNPHFQTIVGTLFRKETMYTDRMDVPWTFVTGNTTTNNNSFRLDAFQWDRRERVDTPDGDFFHVDWKWCDGGEPNEQRPVVLICHGLETNSNSPLCQEMAMAFTDIDMDVGCVNFRGCSGECNVTPRGYHVGFTEDLLHQISVINERQPMRRIYLAGFSLGAGVVTKLLSDLQDEAHRYNVCGAAVNAVPFELTQCYAPLNEGRSFTRQVYGNRILKSMKERMKEQYDACEYPFERDAIEKCNSIMDVENLVIASTFGFQDAFDYYEKCKTIHVLDRICVPQYVLQALDDPFLRGIQYPENDPSLPLRIHYTQYGGHCGYVFQTQETGTISWMPTQLARFLAHVERSTSQETQR